METKYIVKSESQGTYLSYDRNENQRYIFKPRSIDVVIFDTKEDAMRAYEELCGHNRDSVDSNVPVILETVVSE